MFYLLLILAALLVLGETRSARSNRRHEESGNATATWLKAYRWRRLVGIPLALGSILICYPIPTHAGVYRILGFPLVVAVFDPPGRDYVGPLTAPFLIANALIWYYSPHLVLFLWSFARGPAGSGPSSSDSKTE